MDEVCCFHHCRVSGKVTAADLKGADRDLNRSVHEPQLAYQKRRNRCPHPPLIHQLVQHRRLTRRGANEDDEGNDDDNHMVKLNNFIKR